MKTFYFLLSILFISTLVDAQQFSTQFFFTDTLGNRDTVTVGFDPAATLGVDTIFGEVDMKEIPFGEELEVRVGQLNHHDLGCFPNDGPLNFHNIDSDESGFIIMTGRKEINGISCENGNLTYQFFGKTTFFIKNNDLPVMINWDAEVFLDTCLIESFITDWHPGLWFDATCGDFAFIETISELTEFWVSEPTNIQIVDRSGDTLSMIHLAWKDGLTSSIEDATSPTFKTFPNPTQDQLTIQFVDARPRIWQLVNIAGKIVQHGQFSASTESLSVDQLPAGIYFLKVEGFQMQRVVVNTNKE